MPELPEVETTRRGIAPQLTGKHVSAVVIRQKQLRWPIPAALSREITGQLIQAVERRAKYILLRTAAGTAILHLGMSGSLRVVPSHTPPLKADHVDIVLENGRCLRLRDPRRFGALLWTTADPLAHKLLRHLGPEPLGPELTGEFLFHATRRRRVAIRDLLLNSRILAGVGNIYANESLFLAGVRPQRRAGTLKLEDCRRLAASLRQTLTRAIHAGGTTLRDFSNAEGRPGYFQQKLKVYGRANEPCLRCRTPVKGLRLGQRSAFYCPQCQT